MDKNATDKEILDHLIGTTSIRDISTSTFMGWIADHLNGLPAYSGAAQELVLAVSSPIFGQMPELEKVRLVRKLLELDVKI